LSQIVERVAQKVRVLVRSENVDDFVTVRASTFNTNQQYSTSGVTCSGGTAPEKATATLYGDRLDPADQVVFLQTGSRREQGWISAQTGDEVSFNAAKYL